MKKSLLLTVSIVVGISSLPCWGASILDMEKYQTSYNDWSNSATTTSSKVTALFSLLQARNLPCEKEVLSDHTLLVSPVCLVRDDVAGLLPLSTAVNEIWPMVSSFSGVYDETHILFSYEGAHVIWDAAKISPRLSLLSSPDLSHKLFLLYLQKAGTRIRLSPGDVAWMMAQHFSFFVVKKDLTPLKNCTKQNYMVALHHFDGFSWGPTRVLNVNNEISYLGGYCKGSGPQNLKFFGGVCGFATQLFRLSLLIPKVDVLKRYNHSFWSVPYYSDYIYGDDAVLYQKSKQLELKNSLTHQIYLKVLEKDSFTYLVGIVDRELDSYVQISKEQVGRLKGTVVKSLYKKTTQDFLDSQSFSASYTKRAYTVW